MSTEFRDLQDAWRALSGGDGNEGWRTIPVSTSARCRVFAGRRLPGNEEAIVVELEGAGTLPAAQLPEGHGFEVVKLPVSPEARRGRLIALARRQPGSLELFTAMAEDVIHLLEKSGDEANEQVLAKFLGRIRAWQYFMERHREGVLSPETELGLFGELVVLEALIRAGLAPRLALEAWQGPEGGLQDFMLGHGAVEVKTTLAVGQFVVTISALDQLDDRLRSPLYLAAARLRLDEAGRTLPDMAEYVGECIGEDVAARQLLDVMLIQAGLLPASRDRYVRHFRPSSLVLLPVEGGFPRLTRADVPHAIREATYRVDLDMVEVADISIGQALSALGGS